MTPPAAFRSAADAALAQIDANARGALSSPDPEYLHQLRVGLRRLRSALRSFRPVLPRKKSKRVRRALRELSPTLGAARDWDVLTQRLSAARAPDETIARAQKKRAKARKKALGAMASKDFARLLADARQLEVEDDDGRSPQAFAAASLSRAQRKLIKETNAVNWRDAKRRHAVRIRVKRLRYACEFFAPAFPGKQARDYLAAMKELQEILGALNDIAVGRRLIGFDADEAALVGRLEAAWERFEQRAPFWRAAE
jgi:adenylate cyclase